MDRNTKKLSAEDLNNKLRNSAFRRSSYGVDIGFHRFLHNITLYTHGLEIPVVHSFSEDSPLVKNPDRLFECTPAFQRDNDKWTPDMQSKFIESLLQGYKTTLMFYEIVPDDKMALRCEMKIIDGLQRLTAIHAFITGKILAFGWGYEEVISNRSVSTSLLTVKLQAYSFSSEIEAVEFYIDMNENMTHSKTDILRAKKYLAKLKLELESSQSS